MRAEPPAFAIRSSMETRRPSRLSGTSAGSKPEPLSTT
jgi:hypothetical protein